MIQEQERQAPVRPTSESLLAIIRQRAKPRVVLLHDDLTIGFAEADAMGFIAGLLNFPTEKITRLPAVLETCVAGVVRSWHTAKATQEHVVTPLPNIILRISQLSGPAGSFIAVFMEEHQRREDLAGAARRYSLTRRELEVLTLILSGMNASEIATHMSIAETTVADYFKHLLKKTSAKNRADMLAKVLGWSNGARNGL